MMSEGEQNGPQKPKSWEEVTARLPPLAQLQDKNGNSFFFGNAGDYWHPPFPVGTDYRTHAKNIRSMSIRPDDILICSFPKTGLHWHLAMIQMLIRQKADHLQEEMGGFLDMAPIAMVDQLKSPRLLVTHVPFRYIPKEALEKKVKIIYLDRNPKDVLVSMYHHLHGHKYPLHYPGTFADFFDLNLEVGYIYGDIFGYLMDWQSGKELNSDVDIFTSVYEEVKENPVRAVERLNTYLGTGCSPELCSDIARACGFKNLKAYKDKNEAEIVKSMFNKGASGFYRKGEIGDWKNHFTVAMNERFDREYAQRMTGYKTEYVFSK